MVIPMCDIRGELFRMIVPDQQIKQAGMTVMIIYSELNIKSINDAQSPLQTSLPGSPRTSYN